MALRVAVSGLGTVGTCFLCDAMSWVLCAILFAISRRLGAVLSTRSAGWGVLCVRARRLTPRARELLVMCPGGGVCQILKQNAGLIAARCGGRAIELAAVADIVKPEGVDISGAVWYDDAVQMAKEADVDVVVETIGGYGVALT